MGTLTRNGLYKGILEGVAYKQYDTKPFDCSWWYRRDFTLKDLSPKEHVLLVFDGICYRANVYVNGTLIASKDTLCGCSTSRWDCSVRCASSVRVMWP